MAKYIKKTKFYVHVNVKNFWTFGFYETSLISKKALKKELEKAIPELSFLKPKYRKKIIEELYWFYRKPKKFSNTGLFALPRLDKGCIETNRGRAKIKIKFLDTEISNKLQVWHKYRVIIKEEVEK